MRLSATVKNTPTGHEAQVSSGTSTKQLGISAKASGRGSSVSGGELLVLAVATCYCNDLFREARRLGIDIEAAEVEAQADFPREGLGATNITYTATIQANAPGEEIERLLRETDAVAEVHNTIRAGTPVVAVHLGRERAPRRGRLTHASGYRDDHMNLPVANVDAAVPFYETIMGFCVVSRSDTPHRSVTLSRDAVRIRLAENGADPTQDGCAFHVDGLDALFEEFTTNGLKKDGQAFDVEQHDEKSWRVFYVVAPDGLCYWFGEQQPTAGR